MLAMQANVNVASQFWGFLSIYVYTLCPRSTIFGVVTHRLGRACFVGVKPSSPNFGNPYYFCIHTLLQNYWIWCGNIWGRGTYLGARYASHPKRAEFQCNFLGSVFLPTPFNTEWSNSAW